MTETPADGLPIANRGLPIANRAPPAADAGTDQSAPLVTRRPRCRLLEQFLHNLMLALGGWHD
jgi:hypothetical protein